MELRGIAPKIAPGRHRHRFPLQQRGSEPVAVGIESVASGVKVKGALRDDVKAKAQPSERGEQKIPPTLKLAAPFL